MINLFVNYFDHSEPTRKKEIEFCFAQNQANKHIDKIIVVNRNERATYGDFLRTMAPYKNDVNIIANADIYFDDTIALAEKITEKRCYALTRWEDMHGHIISWDQRHGKPSPAQWSQDAWIFRGSINPDHFDNVEANNLKNHNREVIPFGLGIPGCDNKFAALLNQSGMIVTNPSLTIKAIHKHTTSKRTYPNYQILKGIKPDGLVYQTKL